MTSRRTSRLRIDTRAAAFEGYGFELNYRIGRKVSGVAKKKERDRGRQYALHSSVVHPVSVGHPVPVVCVIVTQELGMIEVDTVVGVGDVVTQLAIFVS